MKTTFDTHFMFIYSYVVSDVNYMKEKRNYVFWPHFFNIQTILTTYTYLLYRYKDDTGIMYQLSLSYNIIATQSSHCIFMDTSTEHIDAVLNSSMWFIKHHLPTCHSDLSTTGHHYICPIRHPTITAKHTAYRP